MLTDEVLTSVSSDDETEASLKQAHSAHEHDSIVMQYKELIREQVSRSSE